jgi:hypothetical protein
MNSLSVGVDIGGTFTDFVMSVDGGLHPVQLHQPDPRAGRAGTDPTAQPVAGLVDRAATAGMSQAGETQWETAGQPGEVQKLQDGFPMPLPLNSIFGRFL